MTRRAGVRPTLMWFRDDLRLSDNPALREALARGGPVLAVYVFDQESAGVRPLGGASRWWLHGSLASLGDRIAKAGGRLDLFRGCAGTVIEAVVRASGAVGSVWNRRYGKAERRVDDELEARLRAMGLDVATFGGSLLHEPEAVRSKAGTPFKVFTPFLKASMALGDPGRPLPPPDRLDAAKPVALPGKVDLAELGLLPTHPDWAGGLRETWTPGEADAQALLHAFVDGGLTGYGEDRNRPALPATSRLSPHLRFGEISPRQVVASARHAGAGGTADPRQVEKFVSEVVWRDFAYNLLDQHPAIATEAVQPAFRHFPYLKPAPALLEAWRHGMTGYPIVDAGMRQLWRTGVMHNRVRMIVASFLIKHLLVDWRVGEAWFWDTLCDADPASNPVNWQWVAGSGADPAPYFRIFNPVLQGEKFDPDGAYVRAFVPELAAVPAKWLHHPWDAPPEVLKAAGVRLGHDYPRPVVDHEAARARALAALATMRASVDSQPERA